MMLMVAMSLDDYRCDKMKYEVDCCGVMLAVAVCYCLSSFAGVSHIVLLMYSDAV